MSMSKKNKKPIYHEFEFGICGYSGSGKTSLLEKLLKIFSKKYSVGYVKSDAHFFKMDKEGKDTQKIWQSGAKAVHIFDKTHRGTIETGQSSALQNRQMFYDMDFVLVEGRKQSSMPKAIMLDEKMEILDLVSKGAFEEVKLLIGPWEKKPLKDLSIPYIQRDNVGAIYDFILSFFTKKALKKPIYGLVLSGGQSQRMKKDKATLSYNGRPQILRAAELLEPVCNKVFLSYREGQKGREQFRDIPTVLDRLINFGPMGGIISAMTEYDNATWLVLACDLPYLDSSSLKYLIEQRDCFKLATTFSSVHDGLPEPLCTIYESRAKQQLLSYLSIGYQCPRKALINSNTKLVVAKNKRALDNINHPDEYLRANEDINKRGVRI